MCLLQISPVNYAFYQTLTFTPHRHSTEKKRPRGVFAPATHAARTIVFGLQGRSRMIRLTPCIGSSRWWRAGRATLSLLMVVTDAAQAHIRLHVLRVVVGVRAAGAAPLAVVEPAPGDPHAPAHIETRTTLKFTP